MAKRSSDMIMASPPPRLKFLCSYGGKILPRPYDYQLRYPGGETRVLVVNRDISYDEFMRRIRKLAKMDVCVKYKLPHEDLDALVSVVSDEDFQNMVDEYDKTSDCWDCTCRLRLFLFPSLKHQAARSNISASWFPRGDLNINNISEDVADARDSEQRFLEVVNGASSFIRKPKELPVSRLQQGAQASGGLHAVAGSPLRFSISAADLLSVQPSVSHPPAAYFTPAATQSRSVLMAVHPPVTKLSTGQDYGILALDMPRMKLNSKGVVFQQSRREKTDGSHFPTALPGSVPFNLHNTVYEEKKAAEQSQFDAGSPHRRPLEAHFSEALLLNSRCSSYEKVHGFEFVDVVTSEAEERTKHLMTDNPRQHIQPLKFARFVKDYRGADWHDYYKLDKSSSDNSSSNLSYELQRESSTMPTSHTLASTGVTSPTPPAHPQTPWKIVPSTTYDDQIFTSNGAYRDQPSCSSPGATYSTNFRGIAPCRCGDQSAQIDEILMRQLLQQRKKRFWNENITKSSYSTYLNKGEFHPSSHHYEGQVVCEDYQYEFHPNTFPAYPDLQGMKQHVVMH